MKAIVVMAGALLVGVLWPDPADAWASANRWGGSTSHSYGETSHTNAYGGSSSHAYGVGTEHTNMYGGSSAHAWGGGTEHTNAYGGSTYGAYGEGATHTYASGATAYHPPGYGGSVFRVSPRYAIRLPRVSPAGRGAVLFGVGLLRLRGGCGRHRRRNRRGGGCLRNTANASSSGFAAGSAAGYAMGVNYATLPTGCAYQPGLNSTFVGEIGFAPHMAPTGSTTLSYLRRDAG